MKSCFLFGHANCPHTILPKLEEIIEYYYLRYGITAFYVGNRGSFDALATTAVKNIKACHKDISLYLLLAYHPAERPVMLSDGFDGTYYPPLGNTPRKYAITKANQLMIDTADGIICFVDHIGNAKNMLEHAQKRRRKQNIPITNIGDM